MGAGIALGGEAIHFRAAGIGKAEEFGGFIETFAGGIVDGRAEDDVVEFRADVNEHGMAATDDEGDIGLEGFKSGALIANPWGVKVGLVMVYADEGAPEGVGESLAGLETDHQGRRKAGTLCGGYGLQIGWDDAGAREGFARDGEEIAEMLAGGELGDDAAVFGMELDLRGNHAGEDGAIADDGDAGFIA
jgi:hypothetical protein